MAEAMHAHQRAGSEHVIERGRRTTLAAHLSSVLLFALIGCRAPPPASKPATDKGDDGGARCGPTAHPPPRTVASDAQLLEGSDASCPRTAPSGGSACTTRKLPATNAVGEPVEVWAQCNYAAPSRGPCEWDACSCARTTPEGEPLWRCGAAME